MLRISRLKVVESIQPGDPPQIADDGTILNPVPYHACDVTLDDGVVVQVERPLTVGTIREAYEKVLRNPHEGVDGIQVGDEVPPGGAS